MDTKLRPAGDLGAMSGPDAFQRKVLGRSQCTGISAPLSTSSPASTTGTSPASLGSGGSNGWDASDSEEASSPEPLSIGRLGSGPGLPASLLSFASGVDPTCA